jgi:ABC-type multidrug transport system ATPase subunit
MGYELITEPSITLLDEPTSGLDSMTALRIVEVLRQEANRGMGVLCTIHQPSAQILFKFDRVILLSEGHTVYSGPPQNIKSYFEQYGLKMSKFCNPADKLSLIASVPRKVLGPDASILQLSEENRRQNQKYMTLSQTDRYELFLNLNNRIYGIGVKRSVSGFKQIKLLVQRQMTNVTRDPIALCAVTLMALF